MEAAVKKTVEVFGRLDVCFNAAGIPGGSGGPIAEQETEEMETMLGLNLKGVCE